MLLSKHQLTILTTIWRLEVTSLEISTPKVKVPIFAITSSYRIKLHRIHHLSSPPKESTRFHRLLTWAIKNFWGGSTLTQDMIALWAALMCISSFSIRKIFLITLESYIVSWIELWRQRHFALILHIIQILENANKLDFILIMIIATTNTQIFYLMAITNMRSKTSGKNQTKLLEWNMKIYWKPKKT